MAWLSAFNWGKGAKSKYQDIVPVVAYTQFVGNLCRLLCSGLDTNDVVSHTKYAISIVYRILAYVRHK